MWEKRKKLLKFGLAIWSAYSLLQYSSQGFYEFRFPMFQKIFEVVWSTWPKFWLVLNYQLVQIIIWGLKIYVSWIVVSRGNLWEQARLATAILNIPISVLGGLILGTRPCVTRTPFPNCLVGHFERGQHLLACSRLTLSVSKTKTFCETRKSRD